ncbi:MAG: branched-chain amino acid ABC transporter substrate-binding protein, partial [Actinobacteria bacterium]|nr:branched-chain amino acid ABC transporter substrate-binding protein [Actinomycetota bacterium]
GCGGDDEESTGGGGTTTAETTGSAGGGDIEALPSSSCTSVEYKGEGDPDVLIASDLPLQGGDRTQTLQMIEAIRFILAENNWKAGDTNVAYQSCDDSTAQSGAWDSGKCSQNAQAYAGNDKLVGVIGTFNSGCAALVIPVLNQAPGGAIGMVSPANTYVCLTVNTPACESTEPDKYYPGGTRNYTRIVALDDAQAATIATFAKEKGVKSAYIVNDKQAYGLGIATNLENALKEVGIEVKGNDAWDPKASSYEALFRKVAGTSPDAVMLAGVVPLNGVKLIKDKVAVLGDNKKVMLFAPDGFTPFDETRKAGAAADGMFVTVAGASADTLTGKGKEFVDAFKEAQNLTGNPEPYTAYAAQAAQVVLDAIANSDGSRAGVIEQLFQTKVTDGILGSFELNENGDVNSGAITVYEGPKFEAVKAITPDAALIKVAGGG